MTDRERVLENVLHEKDELSCGPNNTFRFPDRGGIGAIWERVADLVGRDRISLNKEVATIDPSAKIVHFSDGSRDTYDTLISTMPVDRLVELAGLGNLRPSAGALVSSTSNIIGIGLSGQPPSPLTKKCWIYFPEDNCPFYRVTIFSNYSPNNVPDPTAQWSLMAEVSESPRKPVDRARIVEETILGMRRTRLIDDSHEILSTWRYCARYGYPTPTLGRDVALNAIQRGLEELCIFSRGRFGGWKYEVSNQDHSLMQGVELVNRLVLRVPEVTYWFPGTANNLQYAKAH